VAGAIPLSGERGQNMLYHPKEGCNQSAAVLNSSINPLLFGSQPEI
jgi:hypothetical protein